MINLTDKHGLLKQFKDDQLNKSLTMFDWSNLPDTLPALELEKMLQINGYSVIAKYQGNIYAFQGGFSGQDVYNQPTTVMVNNPALKLNTTYTIDKDCVVIKNDDMKQGLIKIYEYYGQRLIENEITMLMTDYNLRMPFTISSSDDQTTQSAKDYLNKIIDGSLGVIGEQKLFSALNVTPTSGKQTSNFADLYGFQQFITAQLNNTIGLATNNNMKRERLTTNEIEVNKNASYPLVDNMLKNRQTAAEKINEMFGLDIQVEYSSIWGADSNDNDNGTDGTDNSVDSDGGDNDQQQTVDEDEARETEEAETPENKADDEKVDEVDDEKTEAEADDEKLEDEKTEDKKSEDDDKSTSDDVDVDEDTTSKLSTDDQPNHDDDDEDGRKKHKKVVKK